jgi:hypothetical protein
MRPQLAPVALAVKPVQRQASLCDNLNFALCDTEEEILEQPFFRPLDRFPGWDVQSSGAVFCNPEH